MYYEGKGKNCLFTCHRVKSVNIVIWGIFVGDTSPINRGQVTSTSNSINQSAISFFVAGEEVYRVLSATLVVRITFYCCNVRIPLSEVRMSQLADPGKVLRFCEDCCKINIAMTKEYTRLVSLEILFFKCTNFIDWLHADDRIYVSNKFT